jgi:hypothetical protein
LTRDLSRDWYAVDQKVFKASQMAVTDVAATGAHQWPGGIDLARAQAG